MTSQSVRRFGKKQIKKRAYTSASIGETPETFFQGALLLFVPDALLAYCENTRIFQLDG